MAIFCTNCGARLDDGDLFCVVCGKRVDAVEEDPTVGFDRLVSADDPILQYERTRQRNQQVDNAGGQIAPMAYERTAVMGQVVGVGSSAYQQNASAGTGSYGHGAGGYGQGVASAASSVPAGGGYMQNGAGGFVQSGFPVAGSGCPQGAVPAAGAYQQGASVAADFPPQKKKSAAPVIIIIISIIVILLAVAVVLLAVLKPPIEFLANTPFSSITTSDAPDDTASDKDVTDEDVDADADSDSKDIADKDTADTDTVEDDKTNVATAEETLFTALDEKYAALADYESQVKQCATDFNNNFTKESMSTREGYAKICSDLTAELESEFQAVAELDVPRGSKYTQDYNNITALYQYLLNRVSVIDESWDNCLAYSNPADHTDEITEPLARDNVDGINRYKTLYEELYPTAKPVR